MEVVHDGALSRGRLYKLDLDGNLKVVCDLHGGPDDQELLAILDLGLTNDVQEALLVKVEALAGQLIKIDLKLNRALQLLASLDGDLYLNPVWL